MELLKKRPPIDLLLTKCALKKRERNVTLDHQKVESPVVLFFSCFIVKRLELGLGLGFGTGDWDGDGEFGMGNRNGKMGMGKWEWK